MPEAVKKFLYYKIKQFRYLLLLGFAFFALNNDAGATHALGTDITYECLGGNQYLIRVSFYRDCAGVAAPDDATVTFNSISCGINFSITLDKIPQTGQELDSLVCDSVTTQCAGGSYAGVEAWVYATNTTNEMMVVAKQDDNANNKSYCLRLAAGGTPEFSVFDGTLDRVASADGPISTSTWYHLTGTWDGTTVRLYVDGSLQLDTDTANAINSSTTTVTIGKCNTVAAPSYFIGRIDEVAIHNRELSLNEITAHFERDRKSTRLNSSHIPLSRMPSSA